jgi:G:T-mismatch repair DNA endonuclease (very short patch repair protein)
MKAHSVKAKVPKHQRDFHNVGTRGTKDDERVAVELSQQVREVAVLHGCKLGEKERQQPNPTSQPCVFVG